MTAAEPQLVEEMFVQVARASTSADGVLTLSGISPTTLYFSDRPERIVGHMTNEQFMDLWSPDLPDSDSSASDPPNAVLSFVENGHDRPDDCVMVLRDPRGDVDSISYTIDVLEGQAPPASGACTLFIDPIGRPLSPVSMAGMRRRERRRRI